MVFRTRKTRAENRRDEKKGLWGNGRGIVFVTGGSGRLGRKLIREMLQRGYVVRALSESREHTLNMPTGVVPFVGDVTNKKVIAEACRGADSVFHLAAIVSEYRAMTPKLMKINVEGTANVLEAARMSGVGRFVFTSTIDVYGRARSDELTEESALRPTDKYGYSKMLAEKEIEKYRDMIDYTIFRMAAMYGPGFEQSYFKVFRAIKEGKAYIIGKGNNHLALVHVDDVVRALLSALDSEKSRGAVFNLSDGVSYTQQQLFNMVADMLNVDRPTRHISPIIVNVVARRKGLDSDELRFLMSDRVVNISKIRKELGFTPKVKLKEAGLRMLNEFLTRRRLQ